MDQIFDRSSYRWVKIWSKSLASGKILPKFSSVWKKMLTFHYKNQRKRAKPQNFRACGGLKGQNSSLIQSVSIKSSIFVIFGLKSPLRGEKNWGVLKNNPNKKVKKNTASRHNQYFLGLYPLKSTQKDDFRTLSTISYTGFRPPIFRTRQEIFCKNTPKKKFYPKKKF